jgi:hypothetical protein
MLNYFFPYIFIYNETSLWSKEDGETLIVINCRTFDYQLFKFSNVLLEAHHEDVNVKTHGWVIWYDLMIKLWVTINNDGLFIQQLNEY